MVERFCRLQPTKRFDFGTSLQLHRAVKSLEAQQTFTAWLVRISAVGRLKFAETKENGGVPGMLQMNFMYWQASLIQQAN
jgi:hypothetical protein